MKVLVACEYSAVVRDAFRARGFDALEIAGFPGYLITACGQVFSRNHPTGPLRWFKALRPSIDAGGYRGLTLCGPDGRRKARVHRLVAEAFLPNPERKPCVRHLNGDASDNRAANLAWGTYAENEADKKQHGTWDSRRSGKLNAEQVNSVRQLCGMGTPRKTVAENYSISTTTVGRILNGKIWGDIPCEC